MSQASSGPAEPSGATPRFRGGPRAIGVFISSTPVVPPIADLLLRVGWDYRFCSLATNDNLGVDHAWEALFSDIRSGDVDCVLIDPPRGSFRGPGAEARAHFGPHGLGTRREQDEVSDAVSLGNFFVLKAVELFKVSYVLRVSVLLALPAATGDPQVPAFAPAAVLADLPGVFVGPVPCRLRPGTSQSSILFAWGVRLVGLHSPIRFASQVVRGIIERGRHQLPAVAFSRGDHSWHDVPVPQGGFPVLAPDELPGDLSRVVDIDRPTPLRGLGPPGAKEIKRQQDQLAVGGMRDPAAAVRRLPILRQSLLGLREIFTSAVDQDPRLRHAVEEVLSGHKIEGLPVDTVLVVREGLGRALGVAPDPSAPSGGLQPHLFEGLAQAGDPDAHLATWLRQGAPLGVLHPVEPAGIFPPAPGPTATPEQLAALVSDLRDWSNYRSAEEDPEVALGLLRRMVERGWASAYSSLEAVHEALGSQDLVCNRLALITKVKPDGSLKHRLVWDLLRSGVNSVVNQGERVVLPRLYDLVKDVRALAAPRGGAQADDASVCSVLLGIDIEDAFHQIPLRHDEQRFTLAAIRGEIFVFRVIVFGSGSAPTGRGRFGAFLGRTTAGVVDPSVVRLQVYVDDPVFVARGPRAVVVRELAVGLLWAAALGYPIAWGKADGGSSLRWIGAQVTASAEVFSVEVPEDRAAELLRDIRDCLGKTVVSRRSVQQLAGRINFFAGLVPVMRPFLASVWAALSDAPDEASGPGPSSRGASARADRVRRQGLIHVRRFRHGLLWFEAFFAGHRGSLRRDFPLGADRPVPAVAVVDASPWGIGGVLFLQGRPVQWFSDGVTDDDLSVFDAARGESAFNTTWEGLALVVALRLWGRCSEGWRIGLRSDSLGALLAVSQLRARAPGLSLVVGEIALMIAEWGLCLGSAVHIPGSANALADALSRLRAPEPAVFPVALQGIPEAVAPPRPREFWQALSIE